MKKKKLSKKVRTIFFVLFLLGLALFGGGVIGTYTAFSNNAQSFSLVSDLSKNTVYIPTFTSTECTVIASDYTETYDWYDRQDENGWITEYCSRNDHKVYTNRCELEFVEEDQGIWSSQAEITQLYVCPVGTSFSEKDTKCSKKNGVFGSFSFTNEQFILAQAKDFGGLGEVDEGEISIKKIADWYGLKTIDSNNYLSKEVTCDISRIQNKGYTFLEEEADENAPSGVLAFNSVMNYISASTPAISKNVIEYDGEDVWTIGNQQYCEIKEDDNGYKFVDVSDCHTASDLICNPALSYCSDDGTEIINIDSTSDDGEGKTCNELYGSFLNQYVPNPQDTSKVCKANCVDGSLSLSSCKSIPTCEEGVLDSNYECVTADVTQDNDDDENSYLFLAMIVGGLVLVGITKKNAVEGQP